MAGQGQETIAIHLTQDQAVALRTAIRIVRRWIDEGIRDAETGQFRIPEEVADETDLATLQITIGTGPANCPAERAISAAVSPNTASASYVRAPVSR